VLIPFAIPPSDGRGAPNYDIYAKLLKDRTIFIGGEIDDQIANVVMAQLLYLQFEDKTKDIRLLINSPGGSVTASLAIYDTMEFVKCDIAACVIGQAAGTALLLVAAGTKGKRTALPHARLHFSEIWGGKTNVSGQELEVQASEIARLKKTIFDIFVKHTGQPFERIEKATGKVFLSAKEGIEWGLLDEIVAEVPNLPK
jgi:ATP-dependent Clp protease protease subunit